MFGNETNNQMPPTARVVKGGGSAMDKLVAHAKPAAAATKKVALGTIRAMFAVGCFVGVVAMLASSKSSRSSSYDYKIPKFDLQKYDWMKYQPPKIDYDALLRDLNTHKYTQPPYDYSQLYKPAPVTPSKPVGKKPNRQH